MKIEKWQLVHGRGGVLMPLGLLVMLAAALLITPRLWQGGPASTGMTSTQHAESAMDEAIAFWEQRARSRPDDFAAHNKLAFAYIQRARETGQFSDYARAQTAVDGSLAASPDGNYHALVLLASLQITRREFALALESAGKAAALQNTDPLATILVGDAQLGLGEYDEALETYRELVETEPGLATYGRLAQIHELRGDIPAAEAAWQNAFEADDGGQPRTTAWARTRYGGFLIDQGEVVSAAAQYQTALNVIPGYAHALAGLAQIATANEDYRGAIDLYLQAIERRPLHEYIADLGDVYVAAGSETEAEHQYELVESIDTVQRESGINTDVEMSLFLADHPSEEGSLEEAVVQASAAYGTHPKSIRAADTLSWALYKAEQYEEALIYSGKAVRLGSHDPMLLFHAGMINYRLGKHEVARDYLRRAVGANPKFSLLYAGEAARVLEELEGAVRG